MTDYFRARELRSLLGVLGQIEAHLSAIHALLLGQEAEMLSARAKSMALTPEGQKRGKVRLPSVRYMSIHQVAEHYCVSKAAIRRPLSNSPFGRLRVVPVGKRLLYLRSDVAALDRWLERVAMTPYGQTPIGRREHDGD